MSATRSGRAVDAVVFDLDDTLIDWWGSITSCLERIADERETAALLDHCRRHLWTTAPAGTHVWHRNTWALHYHREREFEAALPWMDEAERQLLAKRFDEELWVGFFPGTVPTLDLLGERTRLAVMSNNHLVGEEAERLRLHDWFDVIVAAPREAPKPSPAPFLDVCARIGVEPSRAVYVGDSIKSDVFGALGSGMIPVWHDVWGDDWPDPPAGVHRIGSITELPALLDHLDR